MAQNPFSQLPFTQLAPPRQERVWCVLMGRHYKALVSDLTDPLAFPQNRLLATRPQILVHAPEIVYPCPLYHVENTFDVYARVTATEPWPPIRQILLHPPEITRSPHNRKFWFIRPESRTRVHSSTLKMCFTRA